MGNASAPQPVSVKEPAGFWFPACLVIMIAAGTFLPGYEVEAQACAASALTGTGKVPLPDLGLGTYGGFTGGLYPNGRTTRPPEHLAAGRQIATEQIEPLDASGRPDSQHGAIVMISVGMSLTNMMFAGSGAPENQQVSFLTRVRADPAINPQLVIVNGAQGGAASQDWVDPTAATWENVDRFLADAGVTPAQVQVAWVKSTTRGDEGPFPEGAMVRQGYFEAIARNLRVRYPNILLAYFSSRTFSVVPIPKSSEPMTYEDGLAVQWMIDRQIDGDPDLNYDPSLGRVSAPWLSWGPYLWTDGLDPRSDGLIWSLEDQGCGVHPLTRGVAKNAAQLYAFFKTDPTSTPWFLRSAVMGQPPQDVTASASPASGPAPLTVQFHASASDPDGQIRDIVWTFGDGTFSYNSQADPADPLNIQNNPDPTKTYFMPGTYEAYVTITDDDGNTALRTVGITVTGEPLIRSFETDSGGRSAPPAEQPGSANALGGASITATADSANQILLEWSGDAIARRGFTIERSVDGETGWTEIATVGRDTRTFLDSGLTPSTEYFYRLGLSAAGAGVFSGVASAVTLATATEAEAPAGGQGEGPPGNETTPTSNVGNLLLAFAAGGALALAGAWLVVRRRRSQP